MAAGAHGDLQAARARQADRGDDIRVALRFDHQVGKPGWQVVIPHRPAARLLIARLAAPIDGASDFGGHGGDYLIACGLIGEPVPPVMISGGPQKKNS